MAVQSGEEDSFGSASVRTKAPAEDPVERPEPVETKEPGGPPAERKRVLPKALKKVAGVYPAEQSGLGRYVKVRLSLQIGPRGTVQRVRVLRSGGAAFDKEARRVAKLMRFRPGTVDGKPETMSIPWVIEFWPPR